MHRLTLKAVGKVVAGAGVSAAGVLMLIFGAAPCDGGQDPTRGELLYRAHCAACHGLEATGDGPVAKDLRVRPTDLTRLRVMGGGSFPFHLVREAIDGREVLAGHGSREMPVWGLTFQDRGLAANQERSVAGNIDALVLYLSTIQIEEP